MFVWKWASNSRFQQVFSKGQVAMTHMICFFFLIEWKTFKLIVFEYFPFSDPVQNCLKSVVMSIFMSQVISCVSSCFLSVFRFRNCTCRPKQYHILRGRLSTLKRDFLQISESWAEPPDSLLEVHPSTLFDPCRFETWATRMTRSGAWMSQEVRING